MSTYVRTTRDWDELGEWHLEDSAIKISFPPNFMEITIPRLVAKALKHFKESGVPVKAKFSHIALFQDSDGGSDVDDYDDIQLAEEKGNRQHLLDE